MIKSQLTQKTVRETLRAIGVSFRSIPQTGMEKDAIRYGIVACRSNGERVYYVTSATQSETMTPYAASIATTYATPKEAKETMMRLQAKWFGLTGWTVFQNI